MDIINSAKYLISDCETTGLDWWHPSFQITHFGICGPNEKAIVIDPRKEPSLWEAAHGLPQRIWNAQFEGNFYPQVDQDVMLKAWFHEPNCLFKYRKGYSLEDQCSIYFPTFKPYKGGEGDSYEKWKDRCYEDVIYTDRLDRIFDESISKRGKNTIINLLTPVQIIYGKLRQRGIHIDRGHQKALLKSEEQFRTRIHLKAMKEYGFPVGGNPNSTQQMSNFLYGVLGLPKPPMRFNDKGNVMQDTTGDAYLAEIEHLHPFITDLRAYRTAGVGISNFLAEGSNWDQDIINPSWSMTKIVTGRPQPFKPTVVNIPREDKYRKLVKAKEGHILLSGDLSQIELRIMAHYSQDQNMLRIYEEDGDIHTNTAMILTGKKASEITKEERYEAKPVNFLLLYEGSVERLRVQALTDYGLRWSPAKAQSYYNAYFQLYPGIKQYHNKIRRHVLINGEIQAMDGMRWNLEEWAYHRSSGKQSMAVRYGINYPIQRLGALMNMCGTLALEKICPGSLILTIHDQNVAQLPVGINIQEVKAEWDKLWKSLIKQFFPEFSVPVKIDYGYGPSLGELKSI